MFIAIVAGLSISFASWGQVSPLDRFDALSIMAIAFSISLSSSFRFSADGNGQYKMSPSADPMNTECPLPFSQRARRRPGISGGRPVNRGFIERSIFRRIAVQKKPGDSLFLALEDFELKHFTFGHGAKHAGQSVSQGARPAHDGAATRVEVLMTR